MKGVAVSHLNSISIQPPFSRGFLSSIMEDLFTKNALIAQLASESNPLFFPSLYRFAANNGKALSCVRAQYQGLPIGLYTECILALNEPAETENKARKNRIDFYGTPFGTPSQSAFYMSFETFEDMDKLIEEGSEEAKELLRALRDILLVPFEPKAEEHETIIQGPTQLSII